MKAKADDVMGAGLLLGPTPGGGMICQWRERKKGR